jgi:hypothetical protein
MFFLRPSTWNLTCDKKKIDHFRAIFLLASTRRLNNPSNVRFRSKSYQPNIFILDCIFFLCTQRHGNAIDDILTRTIEETGRSLRFQRMDSQAQLHTSPKSLQGYDPHFLRSLHAVVDHPHQLSSAITQPATTDVTQLSVLHAYVGISIDRAGVHQPTYVRLISLSKTKTCSLNWGYHILPPFQNIRCFRFMKQMYLDTF